jgi:lipoprotein-releasing system permease protein
MNGFQMGFIESILEISSYYVRLENLSRNPPPEERAWIEKIKALPGVKAAVPFREVQALIRGEGGQQAAVIRGLGKNAALEDPAMAEKLFFEKGSFNLEREDSILLGAELALRLRVEPGDTVQLISIGTDFSGSAAGENGGDGGIAQALFTVRGIFRSGFYEYDLGWGFINFEKAGTLGGEGYTLGIKLQDRWKDRKTSAAAAELMAAEPGGSPPEGAERVETEGTGTGTPRVKTWRDFNRAFFGALRTEKLFMFVLVGLIFIVVGLNIFQAQRRIVLERREEIGLLRAVGAGDRAVRLIFVWDGFIIGITGSAAGSALGLLISFNIAAFFTLLERGINGILYVLNLSGDFAVFSPTVFYIKELKARVIPHEAALIFLFGLVSALGAAWFASGKVARIRPAEVLRYE